MRYQFTPISLAKIYKSDKMLMKQEEYLDSYFASWI